MGPEQGDNVKARALCCVKTFTKSARHGVRSGSPSPRDAASGRPWTRFPRELSPAQQERLTGRR